MTTATGSPCWATFIQARPSLVGTISNPNRWREDRINLSALGSLSFLYRAIVRMRQRLIQGHGAPLPVVHVATGHQDVFALVVQGLDHLHVVVRHA